jgi:malate dehydrogenase (oxaloacetate-decarboxylating)
MDMDQEPYCDFRMTVRLEIPNKPGEFARLAEVFAAEGANLGADRHRRRKARTQ